MKSTINGTKLNNDSFIIELNAQQMEDLAIYYLLESCEWDSRYAKYEGDSEAERRSYKSLTEKYHKLYKSIRAIQGNEQPMGIEYIIED